MRQLLHQFFWQARRRRALLAVHAVLWFILTWLVWALPGAAWSEDLYFQAYVVLLGLTALLALETAGADPARGTNSFWRTRPPRWRSVFLAQVVFVIIALAGPALFCWLVNGLMLDQTPAQWRAGLAEPVGIVSALLVLTGLRSVARGWTATVVVLGVAGGLISGGAALLDYTYNSEGALAYDIFFIVACAVPAVAIVVVWAAAMRGRVPRSAAISAVVWLILGPALVWIAVRGRFVTHLQITATVPGESPSDGDKTLGVVKLRGVPVDHEVAIGTRNLTASWSEAGEFKEHRPAPGSQPLGQSAPGWLTARAGQRLRAGFPAATRWYSDGTGEAKGRSFLLKRGASTEPLRARLHGTVVGHLFAPQSGFAMKLKNGGTGAHHGTRLQIQEVAAGSRNLQIECNIWQVRSVAEWDGQDVVGIFILHLPAIPAAILLDEKQRLPFRSLRCAGSRVFLRLTMPDAELVSGKRFTADVLSGAELWHFGPGEETLFEARPEGGDVLLYPDAGR